LKRLPKEINNEKCYTWANTPIFLMKQLFLAPDWRSSESSVVNKQTGCLEIKTHKKIQGQT